MLKHRFFPRHKPNAPAWQQAVIGVKNNVPQNHKTDAIAWGNLSK